MRILLCFKHFVGKLTLFMFMLASVLNISAFDAGYHWYKNRISAYPSGRGLIYAEEKPTKLPDEQQYVAELDFNYWHYGGSEDGFYAIAKPSADYNFVGWYLFVEEDTLSDKLRTLIPHLEAWKRTYEEGIYKDFLLQTVGDENFDRYAYDNVGGSYCRSWLDYYFSYDYEEDGFEQTSVNIIRGVFGKVNYDVFIDNVDSYITAVNEHYENEEDYVADSNPYSAVEFYTYFFIFKVMDVDISKADNDLGDSVVLSTNKSFVWEKDGFSSCFEFRYWTDTKGNVYEDSVLNVTVTEKETYTAHYGISYTPTGIATVKDDVSNIGPIFNINGQLVDERQKGLLIRNGKKYLRKR